ncbi:NACHT, LRR and PYD domains-containing protein 14 isoform X2 [Ricinus communis]|nr:NACHT, LRR and PYD domains-containing protein 14 isoform X2 [Ricinus communis]|eukprot:XP_002521155.2 NACHT, LRR and PYD domains-containing protein 14 isoform X2 [Ricinus communis]
MREVPSLISLTMEAIKRQLISGDDVLMLAEIYEIPSHLFSILVTKLPPLALHNLQMEMPYENSNGYECSDGGDGCSKIGRKRGRSCKFNTEWKTLFKLRWPQIVDTDSVESDNWHQAYWEKHLQNCLDEAAGSSMVSFDGCIGEIKVPDYILKWIGCEGHLNHSIYSKLSYHFQQLGHYARCLRLQNVLCVAETCQLLRNSQLQNLALRWIRSQEHVDGLCQLLIQNRETLTSLEFVHCKLSSTFVDAICRSLEIKDKQTHGIKNFSIRTSIFLETDLVSLPPSLVSFLSSGRSLCSLRFSGNHLDRKFARILFTLLFDDSSNISVLDLSDNIIAGWLSNFNRGSSSMVPSTFGITKSLQSLRILNVRNNNLRKCDMKSLRYTLLCMPNLDILDLGENPIEDEGIRCLIPYFTEAVERCSPLVELNLESCELSCEGVTLLLDTLSTLQKPLNSLTLADNGLGSPIAGALGKFLCTPIRELNIGGIGLGSAGFLELQKGMMEELKLVEINISKNRGGLETAKFLLKLMSLAPDLVAVKASYNLMPAESLTLICSGLKASKGNLQHLDLTGNTWDYQQTHASVLADFQHNGRPILILSSIHAPHIPYDDDP